MKMRSGGQEGLPDTGDGGSAAQGVVEDRERCDGSEQELCTTTEQMEEVVDEDADVDGRKMQQELQNAGPELPGARNSINSERTTCYFKGYKYTRAWSSKRKIVYRCSKFRAGCKGKLEYTVAAMGYANVRAHTCRDNIIEASSIRNVEEEMKAQSDLLAIENRHWPARRVWEALHRQYYQVDNPDVVRGLSENQVIRRVHHARNQHDSADIYGLVEIPPLSLALGDPVSFFQFHYAAANPKDLTKPTRLVGWAHPSLVALLRYHGTTIFVDGTFRCVPRGFEQCVVFMVHDRASGVFVPVYYILSTSRTEDAYWDMVHFVVQGTDQQMEPAEVICDFEAALMKALQTQFPNALVLGCLFHMKQALRRAMKRYAIPEAECVIAMEQGVLDMLTVIDPEHVERGMKWVRREIKTRCAVAKLEYSTAKWGEFWGYFRRTWIELYSIEVWNVFRMKNELIARTNNPLERFNRELNSRFPTPHPSMATFVTTVKTISAEYVRRVSGVPLGRADRVERERIELPKPVKMSSDIDSDIEE